MCEYRSKVLPLPTFGFSFLFLLVLFRQQPGMILLLGSLKWKLCGCCTKRPCSKISSFFQTLRTMGPKMTHVSPQQSQRLKLGQVQLAQPGCSPFEFLPSNISALSPVPQSLTLLCFQFCCEGKAVALSCPLFNTSSELAHMGDLLIPLLIKMYSVARPKDSEAGRAFQVSKGQSIHLYDCRQHGQKDAAYLKRQLRLSEKLCTSYKA